MGGRENRSDEPAGRIQTHPRTAQAQTGCQSYKAHPTSRTYIVYAWRKPNEDEKCNEDAHYETNLDAMQTSSPLSSPYPSLPPFPAHGKMYHNEKKKKDPHNYMT